MNQTNPNETTIAQGTIMKGSVSSDCPITVSGKIEGDLAAPSLTISQSGCVHGQVQVDKLISNGEISGEIEAQEVNLAGKVRDKTSIKAKSLEVKLDTEDPERLNVTFGECTLEVGGSITKQPKATAQKEEEKPEKKQENAE